MVVADVQVITDKETIPHGYCYIPEFLENSKMFHWQMWTLEAHQICFSVSPDELWKCNHYVCLCVCTEASVGKKKRICVRIVPVGSVTTAVLDLKLTAKNKTMVQQYTCLGWEKPHTCLRTTCSVQRFSYQALYLSVQRFSYLTLCMLVLEPGTLDFINQTVYFYGSPI